MKLCRATLREFELPLHRPLATAHGAISTRRGWLVELEDADGRVGYGEATPLPEFGTEDLVACRRFLEGALSRLVERSRPVELTEGLIEFLLLGGGTRGWGEAEVMASVEAPCASNAVESAFFDLAARRAGRSLASEIRNWAGLPGVPASSVATQALVVGVDPREVSLNAASARSLGFETFKLKLAVNARSRNPAFDLDLDLERVAALRESVGPGARLRLDANEAWSVPEARRALDRLERFRIDFVEQPVSRDDLVGLASLGREASIDVAADEALQGAGLTKCLELRAAPILVVKPAALGGVSKAIALCERARRDGLRLVWSTLIDGAVGRAVPLALAAGLEPMGNTAIGARGVGTDGLGDEEVHGLGTASLLAADLSKGGLGEGTLSGGRLRPTKGIGLGFDASIPQGLGGGSDSGSGDRGEPPVFEIRR